MFAYLVCNKQEISMSPLEPETALQNTSPWIWCFCRPVCVAELWPCDSTCLPVPFLESKDELSSVPLEKQTHEMKCR